MIQGESKSEYYVRARCGESMPFESSGLRRRMSTLFELRAKSVATSCMGLGGEGPLAQRGAVILGGDVGRDGC